MKLVEQHVIAKGDPRYVRIDEAAFASKNLWNLANYSVRQSFIFEHKYLDNTDVYHLVKSSDAYQALPAKVSNQVLIQLHKAWVSFFEAMQQWREHPEQFTGRPKLPGYKHKTAGRNLLVYELGAVWKRDLDRGLIAVSGLGILVQTAQSRETVDQVRIVPKGDQYVLSPPTNLASFPAWSMAARSKPSTNCTTNSARTPRRNSPKRTALPLARLIASRRSVIAVCSTPCTRPAVASSI